MNILKAVLLSCLVLSTAQAQTSTPQSNVNGSRAVTKTQDTQKNTTSSQVVIIGHPTCIDDWGQRYYSNYCGWPDFGPDPSNGNPGEPPNVGGGGGSSGDFSINDGTTGKGLQYNRLEPGCLRESYAMEQLKSDLKSGYPIGDVVYTPDQIGDPLFQSPGWYKYKADNYGEYATRVSNTEFKTLYFRVHFHYMINVITKEVTQVKMKSSFESGCKGFSAPFAR